MHLEAVVHFLVVRQLHAVRGAYFVWKFCVTRLVELQEDVDVPVLLHACNAFLQGCKIAEHTRIMDEGTVRGRVEFCLCHAVGKMLL